ncbi:MAG: NTE family protein [Saprospiraceae bacterium]|jgi:NTE family protein
MQRIILLLIISLFSSSLAFSQDSEKKRPKIGLVLAGGGAKGLAEVGVIKVLEEAGIRPDYITGTSIGSIVGGLYASGYSVDDLYGLAKEIDWNYYFNDDIARIHSPVIERDDHDKYLLSFPIEDRKVKLPRGAVAGKKISLLLSRLTINSHECNDFDRLPIPFRCVATNFSTGEAVVLSKGSLPDAMRASMSIPSVFEPVVIDGQLLIDGASARNMPVQDVIDMGADIVIAVDIGGPLLTEEQFKTPLDVMVQAGSYLITQINEKQREMSDIIIQPAIDEIGPLDFDQADTLLARGERAAQAALPQILKLIESRDLPKLKGIVKHDTIKMTAIKIEHSDSRQYNTLRNQLQLITGENYRISYIEQRLQVLMGSQFVKNVRYRLIPFEDGHKLIIQSDYQSGDFIRVGMQYDSNLKAGLLLNGTFRNQLIQGSKLSIDARISENPALLVDYLIYTKAIRPSIGFKLAAKAHFYPGDFYEDGQLSDVFDIHHYEGRFDIFTDIRNRWLIKVGVGLEQYSQSRALFDPEAEDLRLRQQNLYFNLKRDSYDRLHFPKAGSIASFEAKFSFGGSLREFATDTTIVNDNLNGLVRTYFNRIFPVSNKFTIEWGADGGISAYADNNFLSLFYLGRSIPYENNFVEFAGFGYMERPATVYAFTTLKLRFEPKENLFTSLIVNYGYYDVKNFLISAENGTTEAESSRDRIFGAGIEFGYMTPLGPIKLDTQYNFFTDQPNFALHMGYVF